MVRHTLVMRALLAAGLAFALTPVSAQDKAAPEKPIKIGIVTFLSGAAAGPFGVPARNAAELIDRGAQCRQSAGALRQQGHRRYADRSELHRRGGRHDQAGHRVPQPRPARQRRRGDRLHLLSGDCLAVAPLAEELKKLTIFFDCGTPRIFEDASYKYLFRTGATATMDNVAAARYLLATQAARSRPLRRSTRTTPGARIRGTTSKAPCKCSSPTSRSARRRCRSCWPGNTARRSPRCSSSEADVVHSSFWGGDMEALILQGKARGLFEKPTVLLTAGETAMFRLARRFPTAPSSAHAGRSACSRPTTSSTSGFARPTRSASARAPTYPSYKMAQALLGLKAAVDKAQAANGGSVRTEDQVIAAFERPDVRGAKRAGRDGARQGPPGGAGHGLRHRQVEGGKATVVNVKRYPAESRITPPDGVKSEDWIKSGFKGAK